MVLFKSKPSLLLRQCKGEITMKILEQKSLQEEFLDCLRRIRKGEQSSIYQHFSRSEFYALSALNTLLESKKENQGVQVNVLANQLQLSPQAISKTLRSLENKAYIERHVDKDDRRNTLVYITKKGKDLLKSARVEMEKFCSLVIEKMGEEDIRKYIDLTNRCIDVVHEVGQEFFSKSIGKEDKNE